MNVVQSCRHLRGGVCECSPVSTRGGVVNVVQSCRHLSTLYTGAYGESWSPRCLLVSVDLLAALGAIRAAQRQSAKNFLQILVLLK